MKTSKVVIAYNNLEFITVDNVHIDNVPEDRISNQNNMSLSVLREFAEVVDINTPFRYRAVTAVFFQDPTLEELTEYDLDQDLRSDIGKDEMFVIDEIGNRIPTTPEKEIEFTEEYEKSEPQYDIQGNLIHHTRMTMTEYNEEHIHIVLVDFSKTDSEETNNICCYLESEWNFRHIIPDCLPDVHGFMGEQDPWVFVSVENNPGIDILQHYEQLDLDYKITEGMKALEFFDPKRYEVFKRFLTIVRLVPGLRYDEEDYQLDLNVF